MEHIIKDLEDLVNDLSNHFNDKIIETKVKIEGLKHPLSNFLSPETIQLLDKLLTNHFLGSSNNESEAIQAWQELGLNNEGLNELIEMHEPTDDEEISITDYKEYL